MDDLKVPITLSEFNELSSKHIAMITELQEKRLEARNKALEREQKNQEKRNASGKGNRRVPSISMHDFPQWGG